MRGPRSAPGWAAASLVGAAALVVSGAAVLDLGFGLEVTPLHAVNDALEQAALRRMRDPRDDPAEIYGVPERPLRAVVLDRARLIHPPEDPGRALLPERRRAASLSLLRCRCKAGLQLRLSHKVRRRSASVRR